MTSWGTVTRFLKCFKMQHSAVISEFTVYLLVKSNVLEYKYGYIYIWQCCCRLESLFKTWNFYHFTLRAPYNFSLLIIALFDLIYCFYLHLYTALKCMCQLVACVKHYFIFMRHIKMTNKEIVIKMNLFALLARPKVLLFFPSLSTVHCFVFFCFL